MGFFLYCSTRTSKSTLGPKITLNSYVMNFNMFFYYKIGKIRGEILTQLETLDLVRHDEASENVSIFSKCRTSLNTLHVIGWPRSYNGIQTRHAA